MTMQARRKMAALLGALALALPTAAAETLAVRDARILATVPGQRVAAAYLTMESPVAARVVAAASDAAASVSFHRMTMDGEVMRMRRVDELELTAGRALRLVPGGVHLMFTGLSQPLHPGGTVALRLTVRETGGASRVVAVTLPVVDWRQGGGHE
ncbi:MAG: copper chaperone PCu(A)C [Rhodocyclales bacterium]|nr:copper chaperone PCu(A)C [Rhodocyclales bacterium]